MDALAARVPPASRAAAQAKATPLSGGTGWGGYAWVTPSAPPVAAQPTYTYAVVPPKPVAAPAPVLVVPVPARVLAAPPPVSDTPSQDAPEPRQLALDVTPGVAAWGVRTREPEAPPPAAAPPAQEPPLQEAAPVVAEAPAPVVPPVEAAAPPPSEKPPVEEGPPVPVLADDVQVAIVPARAPTRDHRAEPRPKPYEIPEGVEINGDLLKQVRLAKGLTLMQVSDRTRISVRHLENVEGDRYDALPAPVYLRGILMSLARELGLDGLRVSKSYLTFVEAHRSKG